MKKMRKGAGRILTLLLSFMVIAGMLPEAAPTVLANEHSGQVHVIVENTTYTSKTAPWQGKLVDEWVELEADSTMMSCIVDALGDHSQTGADSGYISEVDGLGEMDENAGMMSGWMGTLNDWFVNEGFDAFTAAKGTLAAGDEIRLMYSCNGGEDLGGSWSSTDKTVKSLSFSEGALTPTFSKDAHAYTLTVGADVTGVMVTPTASNKNYQVRTSVNGKEYKRTESVPVTDGTVITVKCGDPSWPSMNDNSGEAQTYTVTVKQEKVQEIPVQTVDLKGLHSAQLNSLKLYTYTGGVKGTTDLLADKSTVADGYQLQYAAVKLPVGDYWVEGYDANNDYNGGMVVSVKEDTTAITVHRAYEIYASNSGWVQGTDYTIDYQVTGADGVNRKAEMGTANYLGNIRASGLFQDLDTIKVTLTPIGSRAEEYVAATVTKTGANVTGTNLGISANIPKAIAATVTAPAGSEVSMGTFGSYYSYEFLEAESTKTEGGTLTASFRLPETSANHFLRVQHPDGVTYWSFGKWKAGQSFTVTKEDLHIGDKEFAKDTVYRFDKNKYDRADIYLNINSKGYMNMDVGQTFELNVFRNWMAIESFVNAQVALPDMHYQVVDFEGRPSDVVTVTPDKNNSSLSTLKANKEGTAIVLVTYDAMTHMQGMSSTDSKAFSAIWPECTGVFVVSVGADGSAIQTNMVMDRMGATISKPEQNDIDAEHDILFYLGDEGAEYTFTPENGCTVTVARSTVEDSAMSFDGFTSEGVITDAGTGAVTVTNLTSGRHIVRVEKDGVATYQVITARGVRYDLYAKQMKQKNFFIGLYIN